MRNLGLLAFCLCAAVVLGNTDYKLALFRHFDHTMTAGTDHVRVLSQEEFLSMFHSLGTTLHSFETQWKSRHLPCSNGVRFFFQEIDGNKDGNIQDSEIVYFFNLFDANEDQEVTEAEFSTAWSAVFDGYLTTHSIHCSSSSGGDDDDRK
ncbi:uncharacterized protein LOC144619697 [Crassostrea virginica]